ncbi:MAG: hypothetical protein ACK4Q6_12195, partial [Tepidimonas ignava]|uniref:hypothetical protein n=1 Tax=Tepidimonas ignava TaxID=114249 RepID=UPI0039188B10
AFDKGMKGRLMAAAPFNGCQSCHFVRVSAPRGVLISASLGKLTGSVYPGRRQFRLVAFSFILGLLSLAVRSQRPS